MELMRETFVVCSTQNQNQTQNIVLFRNQCTFFSISRHNNFSATKAEQPVLVIICAVHMLSSFYWIHNYKISSGLPNR